MVKKTKIYDTSRELLIKPFANGIKLVRPDKPEDNDATSLQSISEVFLMPFNVYFKKLGSINHDLNELTAINNGVNSVKEAVGKNQYYFAKKESADLSMLHDNMVINSNNKLIKSEPFHRLKDNMILQKIAIKFPWYSQDDQIIGIFGCSVVFCGESTCSMSQALLLLSQAGLMSPNTAY